MNHRRRSGRTILAVAAAFNLAGPAMALSPASSASFDVQRASTNSGSAVQTTASFRVVPQVLGGPVAGISTSASFVAAQGRVGAAQLESDDIYVDPTWLAQAAVDADPTVGTAGCAPPAFPLALGTNAFADLPSAVAAVNALGRVHLLNGDHEAEGVIVPRAMTILGVDESVGACTGLAGRPGAIVMPATAAAPGKTLLDFQAGLVTLRDLTFDGDNPSLVGASEADFALLAADGTATIDDLTIDNVQFRNFADSAIALDLPGTSGHVVVNSDFENLGDAVGGSATGAAIVLGAASATISNGSVQNAPAGIVAYGGGPGAPGLAGGTGIVPAVSVANLQFGNLGAGAGAVAFLDDATGSLTASQVLASDRGVTVGPLVAEGTVLIDGNTFEDIGEWVANIADVYAPNLAAGQARVEFTNNTVQGSLDGIGVAVRHVGRDAVGSRNTGSVLVADNTFDNVFGAFSNPDGIFIHGVDASFGSVAVSGNDLDALDATVVASAVRLDSRDVVFGPAAALGLANVTLDDNRIADWATGVRAENSGAPGAATLTVAMGQTTANTIERSTTGLLVGADSTVAAVSAVPGAQRFADNAVGVSVAGAGAHATLTGNAIENNDAVGVLVADGASAVLQANQISTAAAAGSVGVRVEGPAPVTLDLGGGAFASAGNNTLDVLAADGWAVEVALAGTLRGENNTWRFQGQTFNAANAVDDLIRDGDADNSAAGGEAGTFGPFDFLPFQGGAQATVVALDATFERGTTAGYGASAFRTLADALEGTFPGGTATAEDGAYVAVRHNAAGARTAQGLLVTQPITVVAATGAAPTVLPGVDGPGTDVADVEEAGSLTLVKILADDVTLDGLVFDGNNPALPVNVVVNGEPVHARNAIMLDGNAGGPDSVTLRNLDIRNFYAHGVAVTTSPGNRTDDLTVADSTFDNIDGFQTAAAGSTAIRLHDVRRSTTAGNTFDRVRNAIALDANDEATVHEVAGNTVNNPGQRGIAAGNVRGNALIRLKDNALDGGVIAVEVSDVTTSGMVELRGSTIANAGEGVRVRAVDAASLVAVVANTVTSGDAGVTIHETAGIGDFGVHVVANVFDGPTTGVLVATTFAGLPDADTTGATIARNSFANATAASVHIEASAGNTAHALVGGADETQRNSFTAAPVGVLVTGAGAQADVRNNFVPRTPPYFGALAFVGHDVGVRVENGAVARVEHNDFGNSAVAAIQVTGAGSEALVELNEASGSLNAVGILIDDDARASMGPGPAAGLASAFFGGGASVGLNKLRSYTGAPGSFAIHNLSILDQNAENNDFATLDLLLIEEMVEHQPDNFQGLVFFDPPSMQFTGIEGWRTLHD
ncbi:MAG: right-handed parallel beta-helix repeat-containing protein [Candidatus Sumerlaeia bacterium]|nr:right-handed parallel beta-helix repeat-containing protein [Candidatus Sumerlaeia bacterium]